MEKQGIAPISFEEGMTMKVDHGMSFFSKRELLMKAAEEGKQVEYVNPDKKDDKLTEETSKTLRREKTMQPKSTLDPSNEEEKKEINIKSSPFKEVAKADKPRKEEKEQDDTPDARCKREYRVNGFKVPKSPIYAKDNLAVQISDPTWHDDGFFAPKFVTFQMKTPELGFDIRRKGKDFGLFQEYLNKVYPHILIPCIPELKKDKKNDPKYWEK